MKIKTMAEYNFTAFAPNKYLILVCPKKYQPTMVENAKKNMIYVPTVNTTIPHTVTGTFGAGKVLLRPAAAGTGVIAGGPVRAVLELAGISDILSKALGSRTPINMVRATFEGLKELSTVEQIAARRGKTVEEILG